MSSSSVDMTKGSEGREAALRLARAVVDCHLAAGYSGLWAALPVGGVAEPYLLAAGGPADSDGIQLRAYRRIELLLGTRASSIDVSGRALLLEGGTRLPFGALLIGASTWRLVRR